VAKEVHIDFKKFYLIGNRFKPEMELVLQEETKKLGYEFAGIIPYDDNIFTYNLTGKPLLSLSSESPAIVALKQILRRIGLLD
jgi:CO dehydrogenase nickel-insertion accessory protein CooC1